jgi:hypothetical protein
VPFEKDKELEVGAKVLLGVMIHKKPEFFEGRENLQFINPNEVIYVFAHGKKDDDRIYGSLGQSLDPVTLAIRMAEQNLQKGHQKIKFWVCFSGERARQCEGPAFKFWQAMDGIGYKDLTVYGYTTQVTCANPTKDEPVKRRGFDGVDRGVTLGKGLYKMATEGDVILPGKSRHYRVAISRLGVSGPKAISDDEKYFEELGRLPIPPPQPQR